MTYTIEQSNATQIAVTVRVPYAELKPLLKPAAEKISSEETEIEGFRKGKAPYEVIKQKIGEFKILEEAARFYIQKNLEIILKEVESKEYPRKSFEPIGEPQVAITKLAPGQNLEYKITLSFLPPVELPDYRIIAKRVLAGKKIPEVKEQEIESSLNWLRESRAKLVTVNRAAGIGDRVEIDFSASRGGVKLEAGESKNHPLILGQNRFLPGFEEKLLDLKAGEEKIFTLAVPQDYRDKSIAGQALEFQTKMNLVQERILPEWNDELAKSLGNFSSAADAEKNIREGLRLEHEEKERERLRMAMVKAIAADSRVEIPEPLVERELEKMLKELEQSITAMGMKFSDYLGHIKKTAEDLKKEWRGDGERRVKIALVLREIARQEDIQPSEEEIRSAINRTVAHQGLTENDIKKLDPKAFLDYHQGIARNEKVFQWLENLA